MKNSSSASTENVLKAIEQHLGRRHFEIIARNYSELVDYVCLDEGGSIVFVSVFASNGAATDPEVLDRHSAEFDMFSFLIDSDMVGKNQSVRFDAVSLFISPSNKALLRHHQNALSA